MLGRVASAKDVVKKNQEVWVKAISPPNAQRLSLSMRDVDQATGKDLLPRPPPGDPTNPCQNPRGPNQEPGAGLRGLSGESLSMCSM